MDIQSFACFHINFLFPMSGAAAYLTLHRRLLSKILISLRLYNQPNANLEAEMNNLRLTVSLTRKYAHYVHVFCFFRHENSAG